MQDSAENNTNHEGLPEEVPGSSETMGPSDPSIVPSPSLAEQLEASKLEAARYKDLALRCQAEMENYRKRVVKEKEDTIRYANATLLERLLPIIDNFELGLEAAKNATESSSSILVGIGMIQKQLLEFLKESGVQPVETVGFPFDPHFHEAVSHEYSDSVQDGHIIRQLRNGYKLRDRLLRPATVVVSKGPAAAASAANS